MAARRYNKKTEMFEYRDGRKNEIHSMIGSEMGDNTRNSFPHDGRWHKIIIRR